MWYLSIFQSGDVWIALLTLSVMEIVLGIDNIIFISILADKLPADQRGRARTVGLAAALVMRLGLLFAISWIMGLTEPLFEVREREVSGRDLILGGGGLFLIGKATHEIYAKLEVGDEDEAGGAGAGGRARRRSFALTIGQIMLLDIVFSLDSVITAVGMAQQVLVMVIAMVVAVGVMLAFVNPIGEFVNRHPSMKILALSFLLLIGVVLVAEAIGQHIAKGTIYFAMAFAVLVELLNMRLRSRRRQQPVHLHEHAPD